MGGAVPIDAVGVTRRSLLAGVLATIVAEILSGGAHADARARRRRHRDRRRDQPVGPCVAVEAPDALEVMGLVNAWRAANGAEPLVLDALLLAAARTKADALARTGSHDHEVEGVGWWDNIANHGYPTKDGWLGENIVTGAADAEDAVALWRQSPGHDRNLLDPKFRATGVALARDQRGRPYWVQTFGDVLVAPASGCSQAASTGLRGRHDKQHPRSKREC